MKITLRINIKKLEGWDNENQGFDELSVSPSMVLKVREKIRSVDLRKERK